MPQERQIQKIQVRKYVKNRISWHITNSEFSDADVFKDLELKKKIKRLVMLPRN